MKKVLTLVALSLYGCSSLVQTNLSEKETARILENIKYVRVEDPVEEIRVAGAFVRDDLNRSITLSSAVVVEVREGEVLREVVKKLPFPAVATGLTADLPSPSGLRIEGEVREVLDRLSALYGVYWTYDSGTVKFVYEKTLIYKIPLVAREKLFFAYRKGKGEEITTDLFDEIEEKLTDLLNLKVTGEYVYKGKSMETSTGERAERERMEGVETEGKKDRDVQVEEASTTTSETRVDRVGVEKGDAKSSEMVRQGERRKTEETKNGVELPVPKRRGKAVAKPYQVFRDVGEGREAEESKRKTARNTVDGWRKEKKKEVKSAGEEKEKRERAVEETRQTDRRLEEKRERASQEKVELADGREYRVLLKIDEPRKKVVVIKDAGIVAVKVTRREEPIVRSFMRSLFENRLSSMVVIQAFVVETSEEVVRDIRFGFGAGMQTAQDHTQLTGSLLVGNAEGGGVAFGVLGSVAQVNTVLNLAIVNGKGRILSAPQVMTLSGMPAKVKSAIDYPYLEPRTTSLQTGTAQLSYEIKTVTDGVNMRITPYVVGDSVILSLGLSADKYLGDKIMEAGQLGLVQLPIRAPREVFSTLRLKAGQAVLIAGVKSEIFDKRGGVSSLIADDSRYYKRMEGRDLLIVLIPRIVRFVEE